MRSIHIAMAAALAAAAPCAAADTTPTQAAAPRPATSSAFAEEVRIPLEIPAGDLVDALKALARQTGADLVYRPEQVKGLKTQGLKGQLTVGDAVGKLLEGTSLRVSTDADTGAMLIAVPQPTALAKASEDGDIRLAQASERAAANETTVQYELPSAPPGTQLEELEPTLARMPEILVKGSRVSLNADIERTENDVQPYVVFSADEVQRSMALNLEDFLKNRLPMNTSPSTNRQNTRTGSNVSEFNLRGLGADETLVLVNGRRLAGVSNIANESNNRAGSSNNNFGQPDINGIPLTSIERIEVLPATAAGIYGGGATGGVINIILKTNFSGLDVTTNYANTFDTDSAVKRLSANGGMTLEGGKTSIAFSSSYSEQNEMLVRDRNFSLRSRQRQLRNSPESFFNEDAQVPVGYTTNIRSNSADCPAPDECVLANLVLKDGLVDLGSPITHIPVGYDNDIQQLIANSGTYNLDLANDVSNAGRSIQSSPRTNSLSLTLNRQFTDRFSMFANLSRAENRGSVLTGGLQGSGLINADAPNNPFTSDIVVTFPLPGFAFQQVFESESQDAVVGAALSLPFRWHAQVEGSWGRSRTRSQGGQPFLDEDQRDPPEVGPVVRTGVYSNIQNGTLDVLRDLNQSPLDLSEFALPFPNGGMDPADSINTGALLRLSGPLFKLPAGEVTLSALLDHRKSEAEETIVRGFVNFLGGDTFYFYPSREATTDSYYLEANVPLVSALNDRPWLKLLDVQASVRRDSTKTRSVPTGSIPVAGPSDRPDSVIYSDSVDTATGYMFGFRAAPIQDLALRMSFSHGFLPPSIAQIGATTINTGTAFFGAYDPLRLDELIGTYADATIVLDGNPNLKSESSDSISTGLIVTPRFLPGLRLSADYTQIKKTDEISGIDFDLLIRHPELYPGRVVRGPSLGDGLPGPITYLDTTLINIDRTTVKAVDLQLDYSLVTERAGSFYFYSIATKQIENSRRLTVTSPVLNSVRFKDGPLKWRGNAGIDWHRGALSVGWNMQYFTSYLVYQSTDDPSTAANWIDTQGSRTIPSQTYHDVSFKYWLGDGVFSRFAAFQGVVFSGGIQNVLNTSPPIDTTDGDVGYSTFGDPLLRRYTLQLTKSF